MSRIHWPAGLFAAGATLWGAGVLLAPLGLTSTAGPASRATAAIVYVAGSVVCHQRPERSFAWAGHALPVCARCTGIYLGAAAAVLIALTLTNGTGAPGLDGPLPGRNARRAVVLALVPALLSLVWEWTTGHTPSNVVRAATGAVMGSVVAWVVMAALRAGRPVGVN